MLTPGGVIACAIALWAGVVALCGLIVYQSYVDAIYLARQSSRNLLQAIDRDLERSFNSYNLSLQAVINGAHNARIMSLPADLRNAVLFDNSATAQYFGTLVLLNAQGRVVADSSAADASPNDDLSDRKSYLVHKQDPRLDFWMSPPHLSRRRPGAYEITVSRRVGAPDGSFAGVVIGTINADYFRALLQGIDLKRSGIAAILMTDGSLLATVPYDLAQVGRNFRSSPVFQKLLREQSGSLWGTSTVDGVKRLHVFRRLQNLPMIVDIAPAKTEILADWKKRSLLVSLLGLIFGLLVMPTAFLFARELRQRRLSELELRRQAHLDSLTGLDNRGTFDRSLQKACALSKRTGSPVSLLFFDLDKFKSYNDTYGHQAGDDVLRRVTDAARKTLQRSTDHFARYGGEEFVAILEGTDLEQAVAIAEQVRASIENLAIEHSGGPTEFVTVSIGVAGASGSGVTPQTLIGMADEALYDAKAAGRNCVRRFSCANRAAIT
ncbi:GGDEF domain-containing protein [Bordetella sp. FB-8]|uniref:sensor domain-containing diguanylate cyclase n=1 Tax=Bordetella sp. FB-8 TaxID=1159870 RepID=UPI0018CB4C4F|nr:GGDEF domain-containing protein [Bordetella sp. FB-8]